jgi:endogenous inhibitor of DNA gyrase (YacG/DUF329 family)
MTEQKTDSALKLGPCPICSKQGQNATRPFCSKRCADLDLSRWLGGVYAIPAAPPMEGDEDEFATPPRPEEV